jgi:acetyl-CoA acetyltransferase
MLKPGDIAIVSGARTPFGRYCGKLKDFTAQELGIAMVVESLN